MRIFRFFIILYVNAYVCQKEENTSSILDETLNFAVDNRVELEKALSFYSCNPADRFKYNAVCFLFENMMHHYCFDGKQLEKNQNYYKAFHNHKGKNGAPIVILDSIFRRCFKKNAVMKPLHKFMNETTDRIPMADRINMYATTH